MCEQSLIERFDLIALKLKLFKNFLKLLQANSAAGLYNFPILHEKKNIFKNLNI